jgi:hypothetical protein
VPDIPIGWPSAIAPPFTFTISGSSPSCRVEAIATCANASLISTRSRSDTVRPALSSACWIAFAGCACSELSGPATLPCAPISASQASPSRSACSRRITTTAAAPSEIGEAEPAVIVPPPTSPSRSTANAGRSRASDSGVASGRIPSSSVSATGSPRFCGTSNGTISSANAPFFAAAAARWWLPAAYTSWSARLIW